MLILGTINPVWALHLYSVTLPLFTDGLDFETGDMLRDPTVLIVIFDEDGEIEQIIRPEQFSDFSAYPEIDVSVSYDPGAADPFLLQVHQPLEIALLKETSVDMLGSVNWEDLIFESLYQGEVLAFSLNDLPVFKTGYILEVLNPSSVEGIENLNLSAYQVAIPESTPTPEPGTLLLFIAGLPWPAWTGDKKSEREKIDSFAE